MTAYLFGWIKFPHDSPVKKLSPTRGGFAALSLAFTIYLVTGFMYNEDTKSYNALKLMSGLAPPANYNILLAKGEADESIKAKYPSFTKCANDLDCFKNYEEGVAYAKENDMPILLDFTGYGCVNCRKTEEHIWVEDMVKDKLEQDFVLISLYVDDRKELEETLLSIPRQEKLRNVGNLWADFQIVNFEQNSQPLYVMMSPDEQVLAPPRGYQEGVQDYAEFLECGLNTFQGLNSGAPSKGNKPLGSN
jgi:thiol:disulfide interchange protein DsbD